MIFEATNLHPLIVFACSVTVCVLIISMRRFYMHLVDRREDGIAVQAAHSVPTPRIGGLALVVSLVPMALLLPVEIQRWFWVLSLSVFPVMAAGLAEDLGFRIKPVWRLFAAAVSSLIIVSTLGTTVPRTDVPGLDYLMAFFPFAALFTVFACTGVCNAFNLIDGINGLSAGVGVAAALGLAAVAAEAGLTSLVEMNLMIVAALMGFMVFNYPLGKIFLGDVGAYTLGHVLAWSSIFLMIRLPELSTWAVMLIFFWPIADTLLAIYRRRRNGRRSDTPDRLHFHQLVMRAIEITQIGRGQRHIANPLATLVMVPLFTAPVMVGIYLWDRPLEAFLAFIAFAALFAGTYRAGLKYARDRRLQLVTRSIRNYTGNLPEKSVVSSSRVCRKA